MTSYLLIIWLFLLAFLIFKHSSFYLLKYQYLFIATIFIIIRYKNFILDLVFHFLYQINITRLFELILDILIFLLILCFSHNLSKILQRLLLFQSKRYRSDLVFIILLKLLPFNSL